MHPTTGEILDLVRHLSGPGAATVVGRSLRLDPVRAAFVNSLAGSVHAFDDTHAHSIVHPGTPVVAAALAAAGARKKPATGAQFLNAVAWGLEITCRVSRAISEDMPMAVSQTGTVATLGAALSAGLLLDLDSRRLGHAIGIAAASASGIRAGHGTTTMHLLPARAASNGVEAAMLAAAGCDSSDESLVGKHGFFAAFGRHETIAANLTHGLASRFELEANTFKPYPCGVVVAPVIDACLALRASLGDVSKQLQDIVLVVAPASAELADRTQPVTETEAQVSLQHWAAAALLTGKAGLAQGELPYVTGNGEVTRLRGMCRIRKDASLHTGQSRVTLRFENGDSQTAIVDHAVGSLTNPMSDDQLDQKFIDQATRTIGSGGAVRALAACRALGEAPDATAFVQALAG